MLFENARQWIGQQWSNFVTNATQLANTPLVGQGGVLRDTTPPLLYPILNPTDNEVAEQRRIVKARQYHAGGLKCNVPEMLRVGLGEDWANAALRLNFVAQVNGAISERLRPEGFECVSKDEIEKAKQEEFAAALWSNSRMQGKRAAFFLDVVRDGQGFILIDGDAENTFARWTPYLRYTDVAVGGTGEGITPYYPNEDTDQKPLFFAKRWVETNERGQRVERINRFDPDKVTKFENAGSGWREISELQTKDGLPIVHLKTPSLAPAAEQGYGVQVGLDRTYMTMLAANEVESLRILVAFGWEPEDTAIVPGQIIGSKNADGSLAALEGADVNRHISLIREQVSLLGDLTNTPLSVLKASGAVRAEGTLQEEKESFFAKLADYTDTLEMGFEDALKKARQVQNTYFSGQGRLSEDVTLRVKWKPFSVRSTADTAAEVEMFAAAGVPSELIWEKALGFTPEEVSSAKKIKSAAQGDSALEQSAANLQAV